MFKNCANGTFQVIGTESRPSCLRDYLEIIRVLQQQISIFFKLSRLWLTRKILNWVLVPWSASIKMTLLYRSQLTTSIPISELSRKLQTTNIKVKYHLFLGNYVPCLKHAINTCSTYVIPLSIPQDPLGNRLWPYHSLRQATAVGPMVLITACEW